MPDCNTTAKYTLNIEAVIYRAFLWSSTVESFEEFCFKCSLCPLLKYAT